MPLAASAARPGSLAGGTLVVPLAELDGRLELVDGDTLGSGLLGGKTWMVNLARSGRSTTSY